ncbi:long-chain-fatty-acid--CoA ligase [Sphingomonas sp. AOB5]|uniref:long-chain-fatty-acid--CoA ligase n=1 Tax=Sphingomonas sp. AOB5 TaxID=3034017 RepID=UPI0023F9E380|nr:long-chain-fatty-acid--CoA ligase [Sphingomonas sp. AOB5]MDF7774813.1 long-chain-fatty-acid--CoA ligase [Sphingomonas sp. AOB5]
MATQALEPPFDEGADIADIVASIATLEDAVRVHGRHHPDRNAVTFDGRNLTFGQLDARSNQLASALAAEGLGPEDRVAVALKNSTYYFETLFGARKLGAVQVGINCRLAAAEMVYILKDAGARVLVLDSELIALADAIRADVGDGVRILVAGDGDHAGLEDYDAWLAAFPAADPGHRSEPDDTALQLYTSGTTGRPKGVMLANRNLQAYFAAARDIFPIPYQGVHLIALPLFHVAALVWSMRALTHGGHCVGLRDFDAERLLSMIEEYRANDFIVVPAVLQMLVNQADPAKTDFSSLKAVGYGGAILTEKLARRTIEIFKQPIYGMYGSTELAFGCTILFIDDAVLADPVLLESCGQPLPGTTLRIVNTETLEPVADGTVGELWVASGQRAKGYWNLPEATEESFRSDGWFRTGDMGFVRDNTLYLTDRLKDMIKTGGENVYPAEVERVLAEHPAIEDSVVIGVPDEKWGEAVKALVILCKGASADADEIIAFTRQRLAGFKCPKTLEIVESLPRTASGKVQKNVVREAYWRGHERRIN